MNGQTVAVLGARGGAGASSFAAALARAVVARHARSRSTRGAGAVRRRRSVVLVDLATGPGLDVLLGLEHDPGPRWTDLALAPSSSTAELPEWAGVRVLARDRSLPVPGPSSRAEVVAGFVRSGSLVVLDLGTSADDGALLAAADTVLIVAPRDVRSAAGVLRRRDELDGVHADVRLVVRGPAPGGLGALELAHASDLPVAAAGRADRRLASALEHGLGPPPRGALARLAARVATEL